MTVGAPGDIHVVLTVPCLRLGVGRFAFDPVAHLAGAPLAELLAPIMSGPVTYRPTAGGQPLEVYPLRLPEGEGASVSLGHLGELGVANSGGRLELVVPLPVSRWVQQSLAGAIEEGPNPGVTDSGARVACFVVAWRAGMRAACPLGTLGELGIEAV